MVSYSFMGNIGYKELEKYFTKQLTISIKLSGNIIGLMHKINSKITNQTIKNKLLKVYYWFND